MPSRAVLFDLDDTLVVERAAAAAAFAATARVAIARGAAVEAERLARDARERARELWYAAPQHAYCLRIGISSWEGLWCRFAGAGPELRELRAWAPSYRHEAWRRALADQGVDDAVLAHELGERFGLERRARHATAAGAAALLDALRDDGCALALVTNGAACLQREKLAASGLADRFDAVVVSGEHGVAKPDPSIFLRALALLGDVPPARATMVGDSLRKDVDGARGAGLAAVWLDAAGDGCAPRDVPVLARLDELPGALAF